MNERICPYCADPVPEGTIGRFCSQEHKWLYERERTTSQVVNNANGFGPSNGPGTWGRNNRNRKEQRRPH